MFFPEKNCSQYLQCLDTTVIIGYFAGSSVNVWLNVAAGVIRGLKFGEESRTITL